MFCCLRSNFVRSLHLDPYDGTYPDRMLPHFYKQVALELASKLTVILGHLVKGWGGGGSLPAE